MTPATAGIRRWQTFTDVDGCGRLIERTAVSVTESATVDEARAAYDRALRGRWVDERATGWGVEPIGFVPAVSGAVSGPSGAVDRLRAAGRRDADAADAAAAIAAMLDRARAHREGAPMTA